MNKITSKTTSTIKPKEIERKWCLVDVKNKTLGRISTVIAGLLMGKGKPVWSPHVDVGDFVIVVNAEKVRVTGKKVTDKKYYRHSGYVGNLKVETFGSLMAKSPETVIRLSVKGMLPSTKLGRAMIRKLKIYRGADHPHTAQNPVSVT